jgi:PAT family beta-lactamase induction signal transducer AmpG
MDRYAPGFLGRRRGWMVLAQIALCLLGLVLAGVGDRPETPWVVGALALAIAFASASHDIAYDAYTVDVLRRRSRAWRWAPTAVYRAAMFTAGGGDRSPPLAGVVLLLAAYLPFCSSPCARARGRWWRRTRGRCGCRSSASSAPRALESWLRDLLQVRRQPGAGAARPFLIDLGYTAVDRGVALSPPPPSPPGRRAARWHADLAGLGRRCGCSVSCRSSPASATSSCERLNRR